MPKGPKGEKRPADANACAVTVAMIATGEIEDDRYETPNRRKSGMAGAKARSEGLSSERRQQIAKEAATARWNGKEGVVDNSLKHLLFGSPDRELVNIKFSRGRRNASEAEFRSTVSTIIFEMESGTGESSEFFGDKDKKTVNVKELVGKLVG